MGYYDLATINSAIEGKLAAATGLTRAQDLDELTENIPEMDLPLLQVVPASWSGAAGSDTHTNTFTSRGTGGDNVSLKRKEWTFDIFVFIAPIGQRFGESMVKLTAIAAAITEILDAESEADLHFGEEAIRSFTYQATRGAIDYSNVQYNGFQVVLTCQIW